MIDWGNVYEAFVDVPLWKSRGWGGFALGFDYLKGYGGDQDFTPSSQLGSKDPAYQVQRYLEYRKDASLPRRCHDHGCEAYLGTRFRNKRFEGTQIPPWGDWFDESVRTDVAEKFGRVAAFSKWIGMDGLTADMEGGLWEKTEYKGNTHSADETREQARSWGAAIGSAVFQAHPEAKILVYYWNPPGGWEDTFVYGRTSADTPLTSFWLGFLDAMATHGNTQSRFVVTDAFFYKPTPQVAGASLANALKFHTQGSMAWLSRNLKPETWNAMCNRIDISLFSWAGTDSDDKGFYKHTGEPAFADQLALFHRYSMGTRRANFTLEGSPDRYCWLEHDRAARPRKDGSFDQSNNWYLSKKKNGPNEAPGGHLPGLRAAARREPINSTPPTITASATDNGDGTHTVSGAAHHADGIRCVHGYVHPKNSSRAAAKMTLNVHDGSYLTNYDSATQDYTLNVAANGGAYLMMTAVSIHDQEHSIRVQL